jgi:hypothetical protein
VNLEVNAKKCHVHGKHATRIHRELNLESSLDHNIYTPEEGIIVLGAAVTLDRALTKRWTQDRLAYYEQTFFRVLGEFGAGVRVKLLQWCGPSRWTFIVRTHPPEEIEDQTKGFDEFVNAAALRLAALKETDLTSEQKLMLAIPGRLGGAGFFNNQHIAQSAYAASKSGMKGLQSAQTDAMYLHVAANLSEASTNHLNVMARPSTYLWSDLKGNQMSDTAVQLNLQLRIGWAPKSPLKSHRCNCGIVTQLDGSLKNSEQHALGCVSSGLGECVTHRHNRIVQLLHNFLLGRGLVVFREKRISPKHRMDITIEPGNGPIGRKTFYDVTVTNDLTEKKKGSEVEQLAKTAIQQKKHKYAEIAATLDAEFRTLHFCSSGRIVGTTIAELKKLSSIGDMPDPEEDYRDLLRSICHQIAISNGEILRAFRLSVSAAHGDSSPTPNTPPGGQPTNFTEVDGVEHDAPTVIAEDGFNPTSIQSRGGHPTNSTEIEESEQEEAMRSDRFDGRNLNA